MFKIGDKLVSTIGPNTEIFVVERIGFAGGLYDAQWRKINPDNFRLANDQEIKANMRLITTSAVIEANKHLKGIK